MYDVIVIGGGPAGMMSSIIAAKNNKKVLLLEKNDTLGKKLLLTGGGRCNITNMNKDFISGINVNKNFMLLTLNNFGPEAICNFFDNLGLKMKNENDKIYPITNKASSVLEILISQLNKYKVEIKYDKVIDIKIVDNIKTVITKSNAFTCKNLIIATGGLSYPKTGSNGDGFIFSEKIKQPLISTYPVATYLITNEKLPLAGVTLDDVIVKLDNNEVKGSLLFTHKGLSGPAIFNISEFVYFKKNCTINIDFLPNLDLLNILNNYNQKLELKSFVRHYLPKSLADYILVFCLIDGTKKIASISNKDKLFLINLLHNFPIKISKTGLIEEAFVTGGGIDLKYINNSTMESTLINGLYFVGEILDVHGQTGGYNLTIAISTGYTAGISIK